MIFSVMTTNFMHLLLNVPARHIIQTVKTTQGDRRMQLDMMAQRELNNFFILGSSKTVSELMTLGQSMNFVGIKYSWFGLTLVSSLSNLDNCKEPKNCQI